MVKQTAGRDALGEFAPKFAQLNDDVLFGGVWSREDALSLKLRSIITVTALVSKGMVDSSFEYHLKSAKANGVTRIEMAELFTHGELDCPGFTAVAEDPVTFVEKLGSDRNIWVVGGNTILKPLLEHGMVDHLIVQVAPVLLGEGIPLFTQAEELHRFKLEAVNRYGQFAESCVRDSRGRPQGHRRCLSSHLSPVKPC